MASWLARKWRIVAVLGWTIVFLMSIVITFGLARLAPRMVPIKRGTADELWEQACHFQPRAFLGHGNVYKSREGWFLYDRQHWHGSDLYRVPEAEVEADLDLVVQKMRTENKNPDIYEHARAGFEKWSSCPDSSRQNAEGLLADIRQAQMEENKDDPGIYSLLESEAWVTDVRWARSKWYWANIAFEWLFLSGLVVFAAWPALRNKGWRSWALHFGLLPILFMLPVYLGYAAFSFTSAGPSGGVLYPWLLSGFFGGRCNELDRQILAHLPRILEPLSAPIGMPVSLSGMGMPGPTTMAIAGLVIALLVFSIHKLRDRLQQTAAMARKRIGPTPPS